jgi:hypothetical protein
MKRIKLILATCIVFFINSVFAQQANQEWSISLGASYQDLVSGIATDEEGNVYTIGHFKGTVDFDPGVGDYFISSHDNYDVDVFIQN